MATHVFSRMAVTSDPELMVSWWPKPDFAMTSVASPRHDVCARLQKLLHLQVNESRLRLGKVRLKAQNARKSRTEPPLKASLDPQPFAFQPSNDLGNGRCVTVKRRSLEQPRDRDIESR